MRASALITASCLLVLYPFSMSIAQRTTKARRAMVEIIAGHGQPIAVSTILHALRAQGFSAHKTTVYRALDAMVESGTLRAVDLHEGERRYERVEKNGHHHHVVCTVCKTVRDVTLKGVEKIVRRLEAQIKRTARFGSIAHELEFFGLCRNCRTSVAR